MTVPDLSPLAEGRMMVISNNDITPYPIGTFAPGAGEPTWVKLSPG